MVEIIVKHINMTEEEKINQIRGKIQQEALESIEKNKGRGLIAIATGGGKSKVPIDYIKKHGIPLEEVALLVPTTELRDVDWKNEFLKWGFSEEDFLKITRLCYKSARKIKNCKFDLVILDEAHNLTPKAAEFLNYNYCKDIIALSATPPESIVKSRLLSSFNIFVTYELTLDEAVDLGIVAPYKIIAIGVPLSKEEEVMTFKRKTELLSEETAYARLCKDVETSSGKAYKFAIYRRTKFIADLASKEKAVKKFIQEGFKEMGRRIIFTGSQEQAERLSPHFYHSKAKNNHLALFREEKIDMLSCVDALNEGANLKNIDSSLITQMRSGTRIITQRLGRSIRFRPGHEALIYIFYAQNTKDEEWTKGALSVLNPKRVTYLNYQDFYENKFKIEEPIGRI